MVDGEWYQTTAWISSIPDLQERIEQWRTDKEMSLGFEDECYQLQPDEQENDSDSSSDTIETQSGGLQLNATPARQKPQHSLAKNIFRKENIELLIFDNERVDGDTVDIYWNGLPLKRQLVLKGFPGTTISLELSASHDLHYPTNRLSIFATSAGTSESEATIGLQVKDRGTIFSGGPELGVEAGLTADLAVPGWMSPLTMALGLVCIQPQWTQAVDHIRVAMGFIKIDRQEVGKPRILTVDRPGRNKRRRQTKRLYKSFGYRDANSPTEQLDEYPPAVFLENYGEAHMRPINTEHNRESGRDIKNQITGPGGTKVVNAVYNDGDQIEMHIPGPFVDSRLFCKDAF